MNTECFPTPAMDPLPQGPHGTSSCRGQGPIVGDTTDESDCPTPCASRPRIQVRNFICSCLRPVLDNSLLAPPSADASPKSSSRC